MTLQVLAFLRAGQAGVRVLLDGLSGDIAFGEGHLLLHLLRSGRVLPFWRQAQALHRHSPPHAPRPARLLHSALVLGAPRWLRELRIAQRGRRAARRDRPLLAPDFARQAGKAARVATWYRNNDEPIEPPPFDRIRAITGPTLVGAREMHDRLAGYHGIEPRDAFVDLRLLRLCLSLPAQQMAWDGWPKLVLRRAMAGLMPDEVVWRAGRTHFGASLRRVLEAEGGLVPPAGPGLDDTGDALLERLTGRRYGQGPSELLEPSTKWLYELLALWLAGPSGQAGKPMGHGTEWDR